MHLACRWAASQSACRHPCSSCVALALQCDKQLRSGVSNLCSTSKLFSTISADVFGALPEAEPRRVVVTGLGLATPLGVGVADVWARLVQGQTGVRGLRETDLPEEHRKAYSQLTSKVVARVSDKELAGARWAAVHEDRRHARFVRLAVCAADEALLSADWVAPKEAGKQATGVAVGAGMSSVYDVGHAGVLLEQGKLRRLSPLFVPKILVNMAAGAISIANGFQGPNHAASTACATGAHAIGDALRMIQRGDADVMVAGGADSTIDAISIGGFCRLKALSTKFNEQPWRASRPFDQDRDGFVIGEGAGIMVLEELKHAIARGAQMFAEVRGYGMSGDAHHITQPAPDGRGAVLAMQRALAQSGLANKDVAYINAHATSTPLGDDVEQRAILQVFGEAATLGAAGGKHEGSGVAVSSTKGATGHLLGGAGAVEAVLAVLALEHGWAPPTVNLEHPDPDLGLNLIRGQAYKLRLGPKAVLSNSFGFGGTNASLLFSTPPIVVEPIVDGLP